MVYVGEHLSDFIESFSFAALLPSEPKWVAPIDMSIVWKCKCLFPLEMNERHVDEVFVSKWRFQEGKKKT